MTVVAGVYNGYIYRTTNDGMDWLEITQAGQHMWKDLSGNQDLSIIYGAMNLGSGGAIFKSTDGGGAIYSASVCRCYKI